MTYYLFDNLGRFAGESETDTGRCTEVRPDQLDATYNWNGVNWVYAPGIKETPIKRSMYQPVSSVKLITHYEFTNLCQNFGGMTDEMLVAAKNDETLSVLWIKFELATGISKDDSNIIVGLNALESLGYLPNGANSVIDNWPI